ncbi:MAG: SGNH/GDSL hydrolase family protein [Bacteroidota bacterium]|nr:SGNH/GDSL hydrolase family protein [Bacteroidota bacterium]
MKKLKKILKNFFFVTIPVLLVIFILLEIISRIFFPGKEAPKSIYDEETHIVKYNRDYGTRGLWTAGKFAQQRARWRINNEGWNSPIDFFTEKKPGVKRIAVIGDSYIEAWQVDAEKAYPNLLGDSLGANYEVYRFGVSGAPLSQYLHMSRYVEKKYSPDIYVFNLVHNDFHESINGLMYIPYYLTIKINPDSSFTEVQPVSPERAYNKVPGGRILRMSSFFRYVYYNLNWMEKFKSKKTSAKEVEMNVAVKDVLDRKDSLVAVTRYLIKTIKSELGNKEIIFIMDAPRQNIYKGDLATARISWLNNMAGEVCKENGLPFIDLTPYMQEDYAKNGKKFETEYDGHWSEYGHQFVAHVLYNYFKNTKH